MNVRRGHFSGFIEGRRRFLVSSANSSSSSANSSPHGSGGSKWEIGRGRVGGGVRGAVRKMGSAGVGAASTIERNFRGSGLVFPPPSLSTSMALLIVTSLTPHLPGLTQRPSHSSSTFRGSRPLSFDDQRVSWAQCLLKTSMSFRHTRCAQRPQGHMRSHAPSEPLIHLFTPILAVTDCSGSDLLARTRISSRQHHHPG